MSPAAVFSGGGMSQADVQFMIGGPDMQTLDHYAQKVLQDLRQTPGAVDVDSSLVVGKPQYGVTVDRAKAADLGVSVADVANTLRLLVAGDKASDYNEKGEQYEIHVRATAEFRNRLAELSTVSIPSSKYGIVALGDVVTLRRRLGPRAINRLNRNRQVTISCNMTPGTSQQTILDAIDHSVRRSIWAPTIDRSIGQVQGDGPHLPELRHGPRHAPWFSPTWSSPPSSSRGCTRSRSCCRCR